MRTRSKGVNKTGSIGMPFPDMEMRIVSLDDEVSDLPVGEVGELVMHGPQLMKGYHGMPTETANALREGPDGKKWLYTGDIARMDEDGYFYIVDRKKDMALIGGFNVYPRNVEDVLMEHPAVKEVGVVAIPHPDPQKVGQEALKAWVVLKEGQTLTVEELIARLQANGWRVIEVPTRIAFVTDLPRTTVGKILRRELAQMELEAREQAESNRIRKQDALRYTIDPNVRAALFDIDGTLNHGRRRVGGAHPLAGCQPIKRAWLYATAMPHYLLSKTGVVSQAGFRDRWVRLMAWLMAGWSEQQAQAHLRSDRDRGGCCRCCRSDVVEILKQHKALGHPVILVSTMFEGIVSGICRACWRERRAWDHRSSFAMGAVPGRVIGETCSGARKVDFARRYLEQHILIDRWTAAPLMRTAGRIFRFWPGWAIRWRSILTRTCAPPRRSTAGRFRGRRIGLA